MIPRLQAWVSIITDWVREIVPFLGEDHIAAHAIDREHDTQGDLTPSDSKLFGSITETEGVNYLPGL